MRLVDDFLFVTTSRQEAQRFFITLKGGFPEYGCEVSLEKALTNFDPYLVSNNSACRIGLSKGERSHQPNFLL